MPLRSKGLIKGLLVCELPILPFLAPRVYTPWPKSLRSCRAYKTAPTSVQDFHKNSFSARWSEARKRWRTRYTRLATRQDSHIDSFSALWSVCFSRLSLKYDSQICAKTAPRSSQNLLYEAVEGTQSFVRALSTSSFQELGEAWEALPQKERETLWPRLMLATLWRNPGWALKFLIVTCSRSPAPSYAISDSLEYIVSSYLYNIKDADVESVAILFRTVNGFLDYFENDYLHLTQKTIFWLLSHLNIDQAEQFYMTLVKRNHPVHGNTRLQFIHVFARKGRTQLAINALRSFHDNGGDFTEPKVESLCATLLQRKYRSGLDGIISDSDIFGLLLALGLRPNIIIYNILLQNAVEAGDSETAWQIHDMMPGYGIKADAATYSVLLNDAKLRMDRPAMKRIMDIVDSKGLRTEYIITDLLHAHFLMCEEKRREARPKVPIQSPFKQMLPLYGEYFELEPLELLLHPNYKSPIPQSDRGKMRPSKETLVVMFVAHLRGISNPLSTAEWYHRFRTMVLNGHPDIAPLAKSTHIYDAVIMSLGKWQNTLHLCTKVVNDMYSSYSVAQEAQARLNSSRRIHELADSVMDSYPTSVMIHQEFDGLLDKYSAAKFGEDVDVGDEYLSEVSKSSNVSPVPPDVASWSLTPVVVASEQSNKRPLLHNHCKPSVRTWSILLKAFMDHKQAQAAEKVLTMMRRQGIMPNYVTWSSLAIGYARLQDIKSTVSVIERFEKEGWEVNDVMINGLHIIENQVALVKALSEKDGRRIERLKLVEPSVLEDLEEVVREAQQLYRSGDTMDEQERRGASDKPEGSGSGSHRRPSGLNMTNMKSFFRNGHPIIRPVDEHTPMETPMEGLVASMST